MYNRNGIWYYDFIMHGTRYAGSTGCTDKKKALEAVEKLKVQHRDQMSLSMIWEQTKRKMNAGKELEFGFDSVWNEYMKHSGKTACNIRMQIYKLNLRIFCDWINTYYPKIKKLADINDSIIMQYYVFVNNCNIAPSTKRERFVILKMIWSVIGKMYGCIENPFENIQNFEMSHVEREAFTPEELKLIGQKAKGYMFSLCLTAISTGLREYDICNLKTKDVNLKEGWITVKTHKTGATVDIPIMSGLRRHLEEVMNSELEYVFPELKELYDKHLISNRVKHFFAEIGIKGSTVKKEGYSNDVSVKDVHSFRHTFVYLAACNGIPFPIVQGIVGHASSSMTKHYMDHANREAKANYMSQIPEYISGTVKERPGMRSKVMPERIIMMIRSTTPDNLIRRKKHILKFLESLV